MFNYTPRSVRPIIGKTRLRNNMYAYYFVTLLVSSFLLSACLGGEKHTDENRPTLAVSIAPQAYFIEKLADTLFTVHSIVPRGQSPETYDPTPSDMQALSHAKAYLYVGGLGFELANVKRIAKVYPQLKIYNLSSYMDNVTEEDMHSDHNHAHPQGDPHYWASCTGAKAIAEATAEVCKAIMPASSSTFEENLQQTIADIDSIQAALASQLDHAGNPAFVIFHPSLTHYARDFGLEQIVIEQDGKEPSPAQLSRVIDRARELDIRTVFVQRQFSRKGAEQVAREIGAQLIEIDPLSEDWELEMRHITQSLCQTLQ